MRFYWGLPTDTMTLADQVKWNETFRDVLFACTECGSEDTELSAELVPAGTHYKVVCPDGHVTVGLPPARFRR